MGNGRRDRGGENNRVTKPLGLNGLLSSCPIFSFSFLSRMGFKRLGPNGVGVTIYITSFLIISM